jgi:hypothetical protein
VRGVGSSNLPVPTIGSPLCLRFFASSSGSLPLPIIVALSSDSSALRFASGRRCESCSRISRLSRNEAQPYGSEKPIEDRRRASPPVVYEVCHLHASLRCPLGIEMAVGPLVPFNTRPYLLEFGMLILYCCCGTAVTHGDGRIARTLQYPGSIIVTPAVWGKLLRETGLTSSLAEFLIPSCQLPRSRERLENPALAAFAVTNLQPLQSAIPERHESSAMVGNSFQVAVLFADDPGQQRIPGQRALAHRQIHLPYSTLGAATFTGCRAIPIMAPGRRLYAFGRWMGPIFSCSYVPSLGR